MSEGLSWPSLRCSQPLTLSKPCFPAPPDAAPAGDDDSARATRDGVEKLRLAVEAMLRASKPREAAENDVVGTLSAMLREVEMVERSEGWSEPPVVPPHAEEHGPTNEALEASRLDRSRVERITLPSFLPLLPPNRI